MPFLSIIPAIRTVPGVEIFDYAFEEGSDIKVGDLLRVPFRKRQVPALVAKISDESLFSSKAVSLGKPQALLRFGPTMVELLEQTARRTFSSRPSILLSWLRAVPKRFKTPKLETLSEIQLGLALPRRETRYLIDVLHGNDGLIETAKAYPGRTLILSAWKRNADAIGTELDCPVLHSEIPATAAWKLASGFMLADERTLVATKLGAWLACFADTVLVEEPENDDFKQDELSPRFDARWLADECSRLRPKLSLINFSQTPQLSSQTVVTPDLDLEVSFEATGRSGKSGLEELMGSTLNRITDALEENREVVIVHPVRGERARYACSSCGWFAACPSCSYPVSQFHSFGICRKCGKKSQLPAECPRCNGSDFSRGRPGLERMGQQLPKIGNADKIKTINLTQAQEGSYPKNSLVVITDAALLAGAVEDIRRRERLVIAWRRLAAKALAASATLVVQGKDEVLALCQRTLTSTGLEEERRIEMEERQLFNYPPAVRLVKILVDGDEQRSNALSERLTADLPESWRIQGPYPVPHRSAARGARFIIQVIVPLEITDSVLYDTFDRYKKDAYIDLDPIAFFG